MKQPSVQRQQGRISLHPRGFGFFVFATPEGESSAFIAPPDLNGFLEGDQASAEVKLAGDGRCSATHLQLVGRWRQELLGELVVRQKRWWLRVDRAVSNTDWPIEPPHDWDFREGATIVAEIWDDQLEPSYEVTEDIGLERCVVRHGLRSFFPRQVREEARLLAEQRLPGGRRDLRDVPTLTIDAPTTTDIDDALAALPPEPDGAIRVLVSIADVDAYVPEGSALDLEARARGTSVYLAGRVIPMLPDVLSSQACSLLPGEDRVALTAELRIDSEGEIASVDVYQSLMRSHCRLSYEEVSAFLLGQEHSVDDVVGPTLRRLRMAAARLSAVRASRGGVELAREEAYVSFDPATREPVGLNPRGETMAHRLVERLMVAANEAIARWLRERGLPALYRVHDEPNAEQVQKLQTSAEKFGFEAAFGPRLTPRGLAAFEAQYRTTPMAPALRTVVGWALGPARYTVHPGSHFGLAAPLYLHFTSPIRRYADLAVHRVVKRYLEGDRSQVAGDAQLEELAVALNTLSLRASKAESERHRMLVARYFAGRIGETVRANVVAIKPFGLVVQMVGTGASATLASDALPDGPYLVDLAAQVVRSESRSYSLGDLVVAQIGTVDEELGRIELTLPQSAGPERPRRRLTRR